MFDSDLDGEPTRVETAANGCPAEQSSAATSPNMQRRVFLATSIATIAGLAIWQWQRPAVLNASPAALPEPKDVTIILFSDDGRLLKQVRIPKVIKTADQWRQQLGPGVFDITRNADTEIAYTGNTGIFTTKAFTAASAATTPFSTPPPNSTRAPDGPATGLPSSKRT